MANIAVRNEKALAPAVVGMPEPVQMIRDLLRWNPFRELAPATAEVMEFLPAFEVRESKDRFLFVADLPGVKEDELEIMLAGNRLMISGNRKVEAVEEGETYYTAERAYGAFHRTFTLPEGVDVEHIAADLKDGVLTLVVPKLPEMKAKKIFLKTGPRS